MHDTPMQLAPDAPRPRVSDSTEAEQTAEMKRLEKLALAASGPDLQGKYRDKSSDNPGGK